MIHEIAHPTYETRPLRLYGARRVQTGSAGPRWARGRARASAGHAPVYTPDRAAPVTLSPTWKEQPGLFPPPALVSLSYSPAALCFLPPSEGSDAARNLPSWCGRAGTRPPPRPRQMASGPARSPGPQISARGGARRAGRHPRRLPARLPGVS